MHRDDTKAITYRVPKCDTLTNAARSHLSLPSTSKSLSADLSLVPPRLIIHADFPVRITLHESLRYFDKDVSHLILSLTILSPLPLRAWQRSHLSSNPIRFFAALSWPCFACLSLACSHRLEDFLLFLSLIPFFAVSSFLFISLAIFVSPKIWH